ncbi:protein GRIM REAPER-like [Gossypium raimondii]|uniref:protein GRIM REAPER-like n=1 Tax=Gossypium raimondii TaxID=29730 RepID=UPI00227B2932|nr:protein GRIM REAPER-like [Gossypium raimondii]
MAVTEAVKEAIWLQGMVKTLGLVQEHIDVYDDQGGNNNQVRTLFELDQYPASLTVEEGTINRFLKTSPTKDKIRKGVDCDPHPSLNICKGISANNGTISSVFSVRRIVVTRLVIGTTAENVATGASLGNVVCGGVCTNVANNVNHRGKCGNQCSSGVRCDNGFCGYA